MKFKVEYINEFGFRRSAVIECSCIDEVFATARDEIEDFGDLEGYTEIKEEA